MKTSKGLFVIENVKEVCLGYDGEFLCIKKINCRLGLPADKNLIINARSCSQDPSSFINIPHSSENANVFRCLNRSFVTIVKTKC